jgi:hypothetical protein
MHKQVQACLALYVCMYSRYMRGPSALSEYGPRPALYAVTGIYVITVSEQRSQFEV